MIPLATESDILARLVGTPSATDLVRLPALLTDASARVRNYTGQDITAGTSTVSLPIRNGVIVLPQRPATAVAGLTDPFGGSILYGWQGTSEVIAGSNLPDAWAWEPWRFSLTNVIVTYSHGYDPIPDDVIAVVCSIVLRGLGRNPIEAGLTSEAIAGYSYSIGGTGAAGPLGLLADEMATLDAYRLQAGNVWMAQAWR